MEKKNLIKRLHARATVRTMLVMITMWLTTTPALAWQKSPDRRGCKDCIVEQMTYGCPSCVPLLCCMARCLWGGTSRANCIQKCDCGGGQPTLADCKKCMARCKCSCVA